MKDVRAAIVGAAIVTWALSAPLLFDQRLQASVGFDFGHFYTIGYLAAERDGDTLYDAAALHAKQSALNPALADIPLPPLYPPQTALLFAPLSLLSYRAAFIVWECVSALVYVSIIIATWRRLRTNLPDRVLVVAAALASAPFWYLILVRQNSVIVLAPLFVGWLALETRRPVAAGLAFGCLAFKPQFALVLAPVLVIRREWAIVRGMIVSVVLQLVAVIVWFGASTLVKYVDVLPRLVTSANDIEPLLYKSVSLRTLFRLFPPAVGIPLWLASVAVVVAAALYVWRPEISVRARLGVVVTATVLANPHLRMYDAVVLAPVALWLGAWYSERGRASPFGARVLLLSLAFWALVILSLALGTASGDAAMVVAVLLLTETFYRLVVDVSREFRDSTAPAAAPVLSQRASPR